MNDIKVVLCDDQQNIIEYFSELLENRPEITVVGIAKSGEEAIEIIEKTNPDVVLMDIQMETEYAGIEAIEEITHRFPCVKSIVISVHESDELIIDAYLAGAVDYVVKTANVESVCEKILAAYNNDSYMGSIITQKMRVELKNMREKQRSFLFVLNELTQLTPRELEILYELYNGLTQSKVAAMNHLELSTVKFHVNNILKKLQFRTIKELNRTIKEFGIFENKEFSMFVKKD